MTARGDPSDRFDADQAECVYVERLRNSGPRRVELSDAEIAEQSARMRKVCGMAEWLDWHGCYDDGWRGVIVEDAFRHPAKFAYGLVTRIYRHGLERGYFQPGSLIGDPFGGVGLGGIVAAYHGLRWIGVELESEANGGSPFVELAQANFEKHKRAWVAGGEPMPRIVQGDSRRFAEIVGDVCGVVTSPPYAETYTTRDAPSGLKVATRADGSPMGYGRSEKQANAAGYGATPGQIGALKEGSLDGVITSPPYAESVKGDHSERETAAETTAKRRTEGGSLGRSARWGGYGGTIGQIGALKEGELCDSAKSAGSQLANERSGASSATSDGSQSGIASAIKPSSTDASNLPHESECRDQRSPEQIANGGRAAATGTEAKHGTSGDDKSSNATDGNADNAANPLSSSTTSKTSRRRAASGTIQTATSKPDAIGATPSSTPQQSESAASTAPSAGPSTPRGTRSQGDAFRGGYGGSDGQIGNLPEGVLDGAVTSPPWEKGAEGGVRGAKFSDHDAFAKATMNKGHGCSIEARKRQLARESERVYGQSDGQIGTDAGETYWQAMHAVYGQMFLAMKPGACAAVVLKDYVKNKARVPLCDQSATLLESIGFTVFQRCRCWLVKRTETPGLFGEPIVEETSRKSFFRRLCESKGSPKIDFEEVLWIRRP